MRRTEKSALFVAILLVALPSAYVAAAEWKVTAAGGGLTEFVDVSSIRREGAIVKAWQKWTYSKRQDDKDGTKPYQSARFLVYFDCEARVSALKSLAYFSGANLDGENVLSTEIPKAKLEWQDIPPDTVAEDAMKFVCSKASKQ